MKRFFLPPGLFLIASATAQDFETAIDDQVATESEIVTESAPISAPVAAPSDGFPQGTGLSLPPGGEMLRGFKLGLTASAVFDSNVDSGLGGSKNESDLIFTVGPTFTYRAEGGLWSLGASGGLSYASYLDNSDLGGLGYNLGVNFGYSPSRLDLKGSFGTSLTAGNNRNYGGYSETVNYNTAFSASYKWSAKTSFDARFSYRWTDPGDVVSAVGNSFGGTQATTFDLSAMWQATPLIRVGPGVGWSWESGDNQVDRETVGPILRLQYQLARKISLDSTFGMDFVDYAGSGGGDDTAFSTRIGLNYQASQLWGMNLSVYQGTTADGATAGNYRETSSVNLDYHRRIRRANLALGIGYEANDQVSVTGGAVGNGVGDFLIFKASVGMPVFGQRARASTFFDWREEMEGGNGNDDGYQIGVSLSSGF
ncbi:hypothetical protein OKA04_21400 [Luteolibacter flavescens]|uniref:Uncharacterized protein n=1 Tax=Luteolibacter flavescens TaxID=1859460 RepID=A0ABT3FUN7_9BACT|nr:hypothetical protein [Luteolibacter flavescens]MCW1887308.1 hypothetical protein [Luteolibacter flavescens]